MPSGIWSFNVIHLKSRPKRMHVLFFLLLPFQEGWILGPLSVDLVLNPSQPPHVSTTLNHFQLLSTTLNHFQPLSTTFSHFQPLSATFSHQKKSSNLHLSLFHSPKKREPFLSSHLPPGTPWDSRAELVRSSALCAVRSASRVGPRCDPSMRKPPAGRTNLSRAPG